ncbi:MAG: glycosyltransferase family 4 protein [Rhodoferax sp.]|nr:glycosyltransferase family 4 protein [Rhodoferax sp.]
MSAAGPLPGRSLPQPPGEITPVVASDRVAFVLKGYPRLSETFIAQEIAALEKLGLSILIYSLRHPTDKQVHQVHAEIRAPVVYLPEYLGDDRSRVLRAWWNVRRLPGYRTAVRVWLRDLWRDRSASRLRRFGQAMVLAHELPSDVKRLHAHFLHTPASVARYAAMMRNVVWSGSAHAKDIWTSPVWELREKLASCDWLVTCTGANRDYLASLAPAGKVELVYHGLDLERFPPRSESSGRRDGSDPADPVQILSVGRLVEKKGFDIVLDALARLPPDLHWRLVHVGGGPLGAALAGQATALGIGHWISWRGAMAQQELLGLYRAADLFVLASRIAHDGDRDGLPNVLMEAQSQALACVATRVSAIPELIEGDRTGILVEPESAIALAAGLCSLVTNPALRQTLGVAGQQRLQQRFGATSNLVRLAHKFGLQASA